MIILIVNNVKSQQDEDPNLQPVNDQKKPFIRITISKPKKQELNNVCVGDRCNKCGLEVYQVTNDQRAKKPEICAMDNRFMTAVNRSIFENLAKQPDIRNNTIVFINGFPTVLPKHMLSRPVSDEQEPRLYAGDDANFKNFPDYNMNNPEKYSLPNFYDKDIISTSNSVFPKSQPEKYPSNLLDKDIISTSNSFFVKSKPDVLDKDITSNSNIIPRSKPEKYSLSNFFDKDIISSNNRFFPKSKPEKYSFTNFFDKNPTTAPNNIIPKNKPAKCSLQNMLDKDVIGNNNNFYSKSTPPSPFNNRGISRPRVYRKKPIKIIKSRQKPNDKRPPEFVDGIPIEIVDQVIQNQQQANVPSQQYHPMLRRQEEDQPLDVLPSGHNVCDYLTNMVVSSLPKSRGQKK